MELTSGESGTANDDKSDDSKRNGKPPRMPWERKPFVDSKAAKIRAVSAAQRRHVDMKSDAVRNYAEKALEAEAEALAGTPQGGGARGGRNNALFLASAKLFELVAAGALTEAEVFGTLETACHTNGLIDDDGQGQFDKTLASGRRKGLDNPRDLSGVGLHTNGSHVELETVKTVKLSTVFELEHGFWTSRESLQHIYLASLAHMCAPWAVLGYCAARALALVRPRVLLPDIIGGPGSLNWFCAIAAKSGGGKSSSLAVAQSLVNEPVMQRNLGSGEGLVDAYVRPANKDTGEPKGLHESIMFVAGEIDGMAVLLHRTGSMLGPNLRDGFSGQVIGTQNRTASDLHLQPHTYRMTLVVNVQPGRAGALLDDTKSGMLQRFMWFPGIDYRVSSQVPDNPGSLTLPSHGAWRYPRQLEIPYEAIELIRDERERHMHDQSDDLAGHSLFIREKFAYALAVLDGRDAMNFEDWQLAGIASRVSDRTREWVTAELERARDDDSERRGRDIGVSQDEANVTRRRREAKRSEGIRQRVIDRMTEADQKRGITKREALQNFNGSGRDIATAAFDQLAGEGVFVKLERFQGERSDRWVVSE